MYLLACSHQHQRLAHNCGRVFIFVGVYVLYASEVNGQNYNMILYSPRLLRVGQKILIDSNNFHKEMNFLYQEGHLVLPRSIRWL